MILERSRLHNTTQYNITREVMKPATFGVATDGRKDGI